MSSPSNFIGLAKCSRCGGNDSNCPVCHADPVEEPDYDELQEPVVLADRWEDGFADYALDMLKDEGYLPTRPIRRN